jgi:hypothetical protein
MRWVAVITAAVLMMSAPCLSACTLAACMQAQQQAQTPPCHQQHKAPAPQADPHGNCDHQKVSNTPDGFAPVMQIAWAAAPAPGAMMLLGAALASPAVSPLKAPPGLALHSVLRI